MQVKTRTGHRWMTAAVLAAAGAALTAATWSHGDHGLALAIGVFYAVVAVISFVWAGGSGDIAAILRAGGDERQRAIDVEATAIAGLVVIVAIVIGGIVELVRTGSLGQYGIMGAVAGTAYAVSLAVLRHRR